MGSLWHKQVMSIKIPLARTKAAALPPPRHLHYHPPPHLISDLSGPSSQMERVLSLQDLSTKGKDSGVKKKVETPAPESGPRYWIRPGCCTLWKRAASWQILRVGDCERPTVYWTPLCGSRQASPLTFLWENTGRNIQPTAMHHFLMACQSAEPKAARPLMPRSSAPLDIVF